MRVRILTIFADKRKKKPLAQEGQLPDRKGPHQVGRYSIAQAGGECNGYTREKWDGVDTATR